MSDELATSACIVHGLTDGWKLPPREAAPARPWRWLKGGAPLHQEHGREVVGEHDALKQAVIDEKAGQVQPVIQQAIADGYAPDATAAVARVRKLLDLAWP